MQSLRKTAALLILAGSLGGCIVYSPSYPYGGYYVQPAFGFGFAYYGGPRYGYGGYYGY
jgi:hypothetical protein